MEADPKNFLYIIGGLINFFKGKKNNNNSSQQANNGGDIYIFFHLKFNESELNLLSCFVWFFFKWSNNLKISKNNLK